MNSFGWIQGFYLSKQKVSHHQAGHPLILPRPCRFLILIRLRVLLCRSRRRRRLELTAELSSQSLDNSMVVSNHLFYSLAPPLFGSEGKFVYLTFPAASRKKDLLYLYSVTSRSLGDGCANTLRPILRLLSILNLSNFFGLSFTQPPFLTGCFINGASNVLFFNNWYLPIFKTVQPNYTVLQF